MNKCLLTVCLLASVANISASSATSPVISPSAYNLGSSNGHPIRSGTEKEFPDAESARILNDFPAALHVTYDNRTFIFSTNTFMIAPTMRVAELKDLLVQSLSISGGHSYNFKDKEIMELNVNTSTKKLITLGEVFSGFPGIVNIKILKDQSRSPLSSETATPAAQAGRTSPVIEHVDGEETTSAAAE